MKRNNFKKRIKSLMYVFMILFISLVGLKNTSAEEVNLHWSQYYSHYAYTVLNGKGRLFYLKTYTFDGKLAYCIELGKDIPNEVYTYSPDYESLGYSKEQIDYISLVAYYGYEYPGHRNDIYYYMASQEMIWEYLSGNEVYWTTELNLVNPKENDISAYKMEISNLISRHKILPSFANQDNYYFLNGTINMVDENRVLSDYDVVDNAGLDIENANNVLSIKNAPSGDYEIKLKRRGYLNSGSTLIYYNDVSQKLFSVGEVNNDELIVKVHIKGANLKVYKYDSYTMSNVAYANGMLSGAKYGLFDSNDKLIDEFITDANGSFVISNLSFGKYYIKELESSYGYELDDNVYEVNIDKEDNELIVYEKPIIKKIEIHKTYGDDYSPEENITFDIIDSNGSKYSSITTDSNGYGYIEIPLGSYIIRQVNSKDGYRFNDDILIDITDTSEDIITYNLQDDKIKEESNPHTYDGIKGNMIMSGMSIFSLISIVIFYFKFVKER